MKPPGVYAAETQMFDLIDRTALAEKVLEVAGRVGGMVYGRRGSMVISDSEKNQILEWKPGSEKKPTKEKAKDDKKAPEKEKKKEKQEKETPKLPAGTPIVLKPALEKLLREPRATLAGVTFDHQGRLLMCSGENGRIIRVEKDGTPTVFSDLSVTGRGAPALDLVYAIDGSIYFIESGTTSRHEKPALYRIARSQIPGPVKITQVANDCSDPRGIALSPRQDLLYVSDAARNNIRVHAINADGTLAASRVFAEFPNGERISPTGLETDERGNVYVADAEGLSIFNAAGKYLGALAMPEIPTGLCWGAAFNSLYIAAGKSIYHVGARVPGTRTF